jgi:RimJ/RimL family protein N-acetyltransferase
MITTERLILRQWNDEDYAPFAAMNADPQVREFFRSVLTREQSDAEARYFRELYERDGFSMFAAEVRETGRFAGFIGMMTMDFAVPSVKQPAVEVGWRLAREFWGRGVATEGARAVLEHAFGTLGLLEVVAYTVPTNVRSLRVMEKIGMRHMPELDFDYPSIPEGHSLRPHVLYSIKNES